MKLSQVAGTPLKRGVRERKMRKMRDGPMIARVNQRTLRVRESIVFQAETFWEGRIKKRI